MKLPVRIGGVFTPPDTLYIMKNPFDGKYEIVADTEETYLRHFASGQLQEKLAEMIQNGALPKEEHG